MKKIRAMIVDDEPLARKTIRLLLEKDNDIEVIAECRNGIEAKEQIPKLQPDIIFLDVQMPQVSGFDVIESIGIDKMPLVIFATAFDEYAIKAFDAHALDYLLKPFDDARFAASVRRAKAALRRNTLAAHNQKLASALIDHSTLTESSNYTKRILIAQKGRLIFLGVDEIDWIEAADYYAQIHTQKLTYIHRETMDNLEKNLDPKIFFRAHRSAIVNLDRVRELRRLLNGRHIVVLHDGTQLKLSRGKREEIERLL